MEEQPTRSLPPIVQLIFNQMPSVNRDERLSLVEQLEREGRWSTDFGVMMALASALATLGLLQGSAAVVIGAMLVAPLMTPLIGAGFALVQGNVVLFRRAIWTMAIGVGLGLAVSLTLASIIPQREISLEVMARTSPTLIDLIVAFVSGVAAAYALARPNVVAAVAGVAIAAALVPPLATIGIGLSRGNMSVAEGASLLLVTNLVAIILGSATVFRILGVRRAKLVLWSTSWVNRAVLTLLALSVLLLVPLSMRFSHQLATGQTRPMAYPVGARLQREILSIIDEYDEAELVMAGRPGSDDDDADVVIFVAAPERVRASLIRRLDDAVRQIHGPKANVFILPLRTAEIIVGDDELTTEEASDAVEGVVDNPMSEDAREDEEPPP